MAKGWPRDGPRKGQGKGKDRERESSLLTPKKISLLNISPPKKKNLRKKISRPTRFHSPKKKKKNYLHMPFPAGWTMM
jgi:hypothetical protein